MAYVLENTVVKIRINKLCFPVHNPSQASGSHQTVTTK